MTKKQVKGTASYEGALQICQNLAELTAFELAGDQILIPNDDDGSTSIAQSLILMPGVRLASDEMVKAIAKLGTTALGVRCLLKPHGERVPDFTVLFAENGSAERFASMRPWLDAKSNLYLVPDEDAAEGNMNCFKFARGLIKARQPWTDDADRRRGLAEAAALLLFEGADDRPG